MKRFMPYLLPVLTLILVIVLITTKPKGITGFAVYTARQERTIRINSSVIIPENSVVQIVYGSNSSLEVSIKEFVKKAGGENQTGNTIYSELEEIGYKGYGYIGDYSIQLKDLGIEDEPVEVNVIYDDTIISSTKD